MERQTGFDHLISPLNNPDWLSQLHPRNAHGATDMDATRELKLMILLAWLSAHVPDHLDKKHDTYEKA